jgi:hypothetical protein
MIAEWDECEDVYELGQMLVRRGSFSTALWREFHCRCCRNVWNFMTETSKFAVSQAERVVANELAVSELGSLHQKMVNESDSAWSQVNVLKLPSDSQDAIWPLSDDVDEAWCSYLSAECAKVVTQAEIDAYTIPESASSLAAWATARKNALSDHQRESRELVEARWKTVREEEEKRQASILRIIVSSKSP